MNDLPTLKPQTVFAAFLWAGVVSVSTVFIGSIADNSYSIIAFITALYAVVPPIIGLVYKFSRKNNSLFPLWHTKKPHTKKIAINASLGVIAIIVAELVWRLLGVNQEPQPVEQMLNALIGKWVWFVALCFYVVVIAPFFEELLFRRILLLWIAQTCKPYCKQATAVAIIVSAIMFALFHADASRMLIITIDGIVLGLVFVRTKSLTAAVLVHTAVNLIATSELVIKQIAN